MYLALGLECGLARRLEVSTFPRRHVTQVPLGFDENGNTVAVGCSVRSKFPRLANKSEDELCFKYNAAPDSVYDAYLRKEIAKEEVSTKKVQAFFEALGLAEPSPKEVETFRATYKPAYGDSRRATSGSIAALKMLREHGYSLVILPSGYTEEQVEKADFIRVRQLVDHFVTSEEAILAVGMAPS
ncbi:had-superfamily protein [Apiospora arundinis]